ncbi:MAG TPA: VOC family protein [Stellaceae bacterium]|nr:VOC family protein [Stellaceae bacterium]
MDINEPPARIDPDALRALGRPRGLPFRIGKIGHVVLNVRDVARSVRFYTEVLGFAVSDIYPDEMVPGGMAFLRCNPDHHGIALVGGAPGDSENADLNHVAFEVGTLDEVVRARDHLRRRGVPIDFEGRRRAGCQLAVEFRDPDGHRLEIYWGIDQIGSDGRARPRDEWKGVRGLAAAIADPVRGQDTSLHDPSPAAEPR